MAFLLSHTVIEAADKTLRLLRSTYDNQKHGKKRAAIKSEVASLFNKRTKGKGLSWKHRFVCLATCDCDRVPTTEAEKDELVKAGLGEKMVEFEDIHMESEEFHEVLHQAYPQLQKAGGFVFCKCIVNTRRLEQLSQVCLSSPSVLKARVGTARTYIRPLQRDLDLTSTMKFHEGVCCS